MKKISLSVLGSLLVVFIALSSSSATIITYNFSGDLTSVADRSSLLGYERNFQIGDKFQAIYTIETEVRPHSAAAGSNGGYSNYIDAILNFQFYVNNINVVDSAYRFQSFQNVSAGGINGKPADWIEITTDGGVDNYSNSYGENSYGEYVDSYFWLVDYTGTALDDYNKTFTGNIPLTFDMEEFSYGYIQIDGESSVYPDAYRYQLRGDVTSFSNEGHSVSEEGFHPVPEPSTMLLFGSSLVAIAGMRYRKKGMK